MKITGPENYRLSFTADQFTARCSRGTAKFSGLATRAIPKIYIVSIDQSPIYVGLTRQSMRTRLRVGWRAQGKGGYHGYAFRRAINEADLSIWGHEDATSESSCRDMETVEAEIVYLIRKAGQWPKYQTEIHFHPSSDEHRRVAAMIMAHYQVAIASSS